MQTVGFFDSGINFDYLNMHVVSRDKADELDEKAPEKYKIEDHRGTLLDSSSLMMHRLSYGYKVDAISANCKLSARFSGYQSQFSKKSINTALM
jgi:hypothetical protein